jgi:hypothetical protein
MSATTAVHHPGRLFRESGDGNLLFCGTAPGTLPRQRPTSSSLGVLALHDHDHEHGLRSRTRILPTITITSTITVLGHDAVFQTRSELSSQG